MTAYVKTVWADEVPDSTPVKYSITGDVEGEISASAEIAVVTPITAGTAINAANLNHLETGVYNAQEQLTALEASVALDVTGWTAAGNTLVYVSANSFKVVGSDVTAKYRKGTKIKLTDAATVKYFYVTLSAYAASDTTVTIYAGSDYTLAGGVISLPYYSYQTCPQGHPIWFNYTVTHTGFSANPTYKARFMLEGNKCTTVYSVSANGTSNQTYYTVTVPITAVVIANMGWGAAAYNTYDASAFEGLCSVSIVSAGTVFTLTRQPGFSATWTNSGTKGTSFQIIYEI